MLLLSAFSSFYVEECLAQDPTPPPPTPAPPLVPPPPPEAPDVELPTEWCRNTVTQEDIDGKGCIPLPQHICCLQFHDGEEQEGLESILPHPQLGRAGVYTTLPHPTNHSAAVLTRCDEWETQKTKRGAASDFCLCLYESGEIFQLSDRCCSLYRKFDTPGLDKRTQYPYCNKRWHAYNTETDVMKVCALRADMYPRMQDALTGEAERLRGLNQVSGLVRCGLFAGAAVLQLLLVLSP